MGPVRSECLAVDLNSASIEDALFIIAKTIIIHHG